MLVEYSKKDNLTEIIGYLGKHFKSVPYLYTDIKLFQQCNESVRLWTDIDSNTIKGIYLLYYDCLHFFTKDVGNYQIDKILSFIEEYRPRVMMYQDEVGYRLKEKLIDVYDFERNCIIDMDDISREDYVEYRSEVADRSEIEPYVDLMLTSERYAQVYDRKVLLDQMLDRYDMGTARYVVIKDEDQIVAGECTFGEIDDMGLIGGLIVHDDYRRMGFAADVTAKICEELAADNKTRIGFVDYDNSPSIELHRKMGAKECGVYFKYVMK